jgi:hypothetical protein
MNLRFVLVGEKGAVQFFLFTAFFHSSDRSEINETGGISGPNGYFLFVDRSMLAMPADLGYHALEPHYPGQSDMECKYVSTGKCYYDGSGLNAEDAFDVFTDEGEEALWVFLERYYEAVFNGGEYPPQLGRRWKAQMEDMKR